MLAIFSHHCAEYLPPIRASRRINCTLVISTIEARLCYRLRFKGPINRRMRAQDAYGARRWISRTPRLMRPMLIAGAAEAVMQHEDLVGRAPSHHDSARCFEAKNTQRLYRARQDLHRRPWTLAGYRDSRRSSPLLIRSGWVSHERYLQGAFWFKIEAVASDGVRLMR
jgi:hypothetical protein